MKKQLIISFMYLLAAAMVAIAQSTSLPDVSLYTLDGKEIWASTFSYEGMPMIMTFWKTTEKIVVSNWFNYMTSMSKFSNTKGVKMIAKCIDCSGSTQHVNPFVYGNSLTLMCMSIKMGILKEPLEFRRLPLPFCLISKWDSTADIQAIAVISTNWFARR